MIVSATKFKAAGGKPAGKGQAALEAYLANSILPQTVVAGTKDFIFAQLILDAAALRTDTEVRELNFEVTTSQANPAEVSSWSLYDGNTQFATVNDPDAESGSRTTDGDSATIKFTLTNPIIIPYGASKVLTVKGYISTAATNGQMQVGVK